MRAVSIRQPYATMIAEGRKTLEIRSWPVRKGPVVICSTLRPRLAGYPRGVMLCTVDIVGCRPFKPHDFAAAGNVAWKPDLFAWELANVRVVPHHPVDGRRGIFEVEIPEGAPDAPRDMELGFGKERKDE